DSHQKKRPGCSQGVFFGANPVDILPIIFRRAIPGASGGFQGYVASTRPDHAAFENASVDRSLFFSVPSVCSVRNGIFTKHCSGKCSSIPPTHNHNPLFLLYFSFAFPLCPLRPLCLRFYLFSFSFAFLRAPVKRTPQGGIEKKVLK
ncbi:MAG: hypothetical protein Q8L40_01635, partial [Burkholderiales bacterium]|nr:hypothetical protein [Burkholderiales bacterium]